MSFKFRYFFVPFLTWFTASSVAQRPWERRPTSSVPHHYHYDPNYNRDLYYGSHGADISYGKERSYPDDWDPGDHRCRGAYTDKYPLTAIVETASTIFEGRYVYLCDGPDVNYRDRPQANKEYPILMKIERNVTVFLGIPYAKPPVRELRFKPPEYPQPFTRYRAWEYKPSCPQPFTYESKERGIVEIDEDCLYLNVFSPFVASSLDKKYPVMIYIHGGFWESGSANTFPAHMLSYSQEVVVVTLNYRLGSLGFFSTADSASPGNYGLLDQDMAINWVYENIMAFNGDPLNITLFGPDAGGASAGLHMFNPRTSKLVKRIIAQSGSAVADWAVISDPNFVRNNSILFGIAMGCDTRSSWNLVKCLRTRNFKELTSSELRPIVGWVSWAPVVDGYSARRDDQAVPDLPEIELARGYIVPDRDFAYMSGVTRDEAVSMLLRNKELIKKSYDVTRDYFRKEVKKYAEMYNYTLYPEGLNNAIEFLYFPWSDPENRTLLRQGYIDMLSDSYFKAPNDKMVKLMLLNNVRTFMYVLNYTAEGIPKPEWQGVPHESENSFISGAPFMDPGFYPRYLDLEKVEWTESDRNMSIFFMEAFANFAKYGNPTPATPQRILKTIFWEPMQLNNFQYLSINTTNMTSVMLRDYRQKECHFWNFYIPKLIDKIPPTWPPTLEPLQEELRIYQSSLWGVTAAAGLFLLLTLLFCCLFCHAKGNQSDMDSIRDPISSSTDISLRPDYKTRYISDDSFAMRDPNRHTSV